MVARTQRLVVVVEDPRDEGRRADVVLARNVPDLSRRAAKAMALGGALSIGGRKAKPSTIVQKGDTLELQWDAPQSEGPPLRVLHTTDDLVFVDKPSGLHTHRLRPDQPVALADLVVREHPECARASADPRECGALHRLDRDTTGVLAFARHREAWERIRSAFEEDRVSKLYLALCHRRAPQWPPAPPPDCMPIEQPRPPLPSSIPSAPESPAVELRPPLGHGDGADRVAVRPDGLACRTVAWPLATRDAGRQLLVLLRLDTGRRHQARAHLAWCGLPIVGDDRYGAASEGGHLYLHALSLAIPGVQAVVAPPTGPWIDVLADCHVSSWSTTAAARSVPPNPH